MEKNLIITRKTINFAKKMMNIDRDILQIALPAIVSNITVPLLGLVDVAIVGHLGSAAYIGSIAIGSMVFNVVYWLFAFLRMGTSGMTSQALGARRLDQCVVLLHRSLTVSIAIALLFLLLQQPIRQLAFLLMQPTDDVAHLTATYYSICVWGAPAVLGLYSLSGWFIGMQNSRIPMAIAITQNLVNIAASLFFVFGLGMKVEGVALGTVIAQYTGVGLALLLWFKHYGRLRKFHPKASSPALREGAMLRRFFSVNRDIFLRTLFLVAVNLFITSAGSWQGEDILAVNALLMQFFMVYSYFMDGFAYAGEAICGKALGAHNRPRFTTTIRHLFLWGAAVSILFLLTYLTLGNTFISWLTDQPSVIQLARTYFPWMLLVPLSGLAAFLWDGIFIGTTATRSMLFATLAGAVVFFTTYYLVPYLHILSTNHILWLAFILYLLARGLTQTFLYPTILRQV